MFVVFVPEKGVIAILKDDLSSSAREWGVWKNAGTKKQLREAAVMEFQMRKMLLHCVESAHAGGTKGSFSGEKMSVLFSDENNTHQCPSNEFMYDIWERITTKCNGYRWSRVGGECKKVWESFCLRFEGGEEKEEDTMLCWNIQRKRLLTQVKAPRGLILVFIRHHTKRREKHTNHKKLIIAAVTRLQCHSQNESICHILVYGYALELCMCECMCAGG